LSGALAGNRGAATADDARYRSIRKLCHPASGRGFVREGLARPGLQKHQPVFSTPPPMNAPGADGEKMVAFAVNLKEDSLFQASRGVVCFVHLNPDKPHPTPFSLNRTGSAAARPPVFRDCLMLSSLSVTFAPLRCKKNWIDAGIEEAIAARRPASRQAALIDFPDSFKNVAPFRDSPSFGCDPSTADDPSTGFFFARADRAPPGLFSSRDGLAA